MDKNQPMTALLPLVFSLTPMVTHAATSQNAAPERDTVIVTATPSDVNPTDDTRAGAGFQTQDITVGPLGNKAWLDTPYSTTTISHELIKNQQATSVSELLKYAPSTQMQARGGMDVGRPQSRGMQGSVVANSRLDGLNIVATTAFPVEMLDRLDILNSLTGALYGPASPAGQFNFVAKRPTVQTLHEVALGFQSRDAWNAHVDLGGHLDEGQRLGYRFNALDEEGEGNMADSTLRRKLLSLALDWNIRPGTQLQLNTSHYEFIQKGYAGGFSYYPGVKLPSAPNGKNRHLALKTAGNDLTTDTVSTRLIHYFNNDWSLNAGVGWQQADRAMRSVSSTIIDNAGDMNRTIKNSGAAGRFRVLSNTVTLNGHTQAGSVGHDLAFAITGYIWTLYGGKSRGIAYNLGESNIHHPSQMEEPGDGKIHRHGARYKSSDNTQQSITLGDTLTFSPKWSALAYVSQSWIRSRNFSKNGHKTGENNQNGLSPDVALMYKITPQVMAYISYADSLEQGSSAPIDDSIKNSGQTLNPYRSKQYEAGLKAQLGDMNLSAAVFRLKRPFAYVDSSDMVYREQGKQVNNGLELTAAGCVGSGLNIFSGVTFLDPQLKNTASRATRNKRVVGVPKVQANMLVEYSFPSLPQWVYSANIHYTGKRAANDTNTTWADGYTTLDLGTRYTTRLNKLQTTFRVSVDNVTDKHYWASIFPSDTDGNGGSPSAYIGGGREIRASVTFDF